MSYDDIIIHGTCSKVSSMALVSDVFLPPDQLSVEEVIKCMYQIGTAIDCLNRHGIFHNHVKVENIMAKNGHYILSGLLGVDHTGNDVKSYAEAFKELLTISNFTKEQEELVNKFLTPCLNVYEELRPTMAMVLAHPIFDHVRTLPTYEVYYPTHTTSPPASAIEALLNLCDQYPEQPAAVAFTAIELLYTCWDRLSGDLIPVLYWISVALCGYEMDMKEFCIDNEIEFDEGS
jgi:serine/threonine protein kinase